jgi:hypothetical protein
MGDHGRSKSWLYSTLIYEAGQMALLFYSDIYVLNTFRRSDFSTGESGILFVIVLTDSSHTISHCFPQKVRLFQQSCYNLEVSFLVFCLLLRFHDTNLAQTSHSDFSVKIYKVFNIIWSEEYKLTQSWKVMVKSCFKWFSQHLFWSGG